MWKRLILLEEAAQSESNETRKRKFVWFTRSAKVFLQRLHRRQLCPPFSPSVFLPPPSQMCEEPSLGFWCDLISTTPLLGLPLLYIYKCLCVFLIPLGRRSGWHSLSSKCVFLPATAAGEWKFEMRRMPSLFSVLLMLSPQSPQRTNIQELCTFSCSSACSPAVIFI